MKNAKVDTIISGFLEYLKKEGSLSLLPEIARKLSSKADEVALTAKVLTTDVLSTSQQSKILEILKTNFGVKSAEFEQDNGLIGGMKVWIGDQVIDLSIQNKLNRLNKSL